MAVIELSNLEEAQTLAEPPRRPSHHRRGPERPGLRAIAVATTIVVATSIVVLLEQEEVPPPATEEERRDREAIRAMASTMWSFTDPCLLGDVACCPAITRHPPFGSASDVPIGSAVGSIGIHRPLQRQGTTRTRVADNEEEDHAATI